MQILFVTAHPHYPQIAGGSQSSTHELALDLIECGHSVSILSGLYPKDLLGLKTRLRLKVFKKSFVKDRLPGYPTYRKWHVWDDTVEVLEEVRPDVVCVTAGQPFKVAAAISASGYPLLVYLRDVEFERQGGTPADLPKSTVYVANSQFTAEAYSERYGIDVDVIAPLFDRTKYETTSSKEFVSFINPHPSKGSEIAFGVASACPEIPFLFVEGWPLNKYEEELNRARYKAMSNIVFKPRTRDMREIYGATKILLVPSQWHEAWGRISTEAQFSGIPIIGSNIGGLPESIGDGGILIEPKADIQIWVDAVTELWNDQDRFANLSKRAKERSYRAEINPEKQRKHFENLLEMAISKSSS